MAKEYLDKNGLSYFWSIIKSKFDKRQPYAHYKTNGNLTGKYLKISINSYTSWMLCFKIRLYQSYRATELMISGYNYGSSYWYSPKAVNIGDSGNGSITVYFGYDSKWHLWVAIPGNSYSALDIYNVTNGYTQVDDLESLFTIEEVDSLPETMQTSVNAYSPWLRNETVTNATNATNATKVNNHTVNTDVPSNAVFTDTVYTHPTYSAKSNGLYKITVDDKGHVSNTINVAKSDITALGIPAQDTTYNVATTTTNGLLSSSDKVKLDSIDSSGKISYMRKEEDIYTTVSASESTIPVPFNNLSSADILLIDINGLDLVEDTDYTRSGNNIVLTTPITTIGTVIHFIALRSTTATTQDYAVLKGDPGDVSDVRVDNTSVVTNGIAEIDTSSFLSSFLDFFYPVGTIYETTKSVEEFNPNTAWGGTWERIIGRTLFGAYDRGELTAALNTNTNTPFGTTTTNGDDPSLWKIPLGDTGGEYHHVLTTNEMPSHRHISGYQRSVYPGGATWGAMISWKADGATTVYSTETGGNAKHANMPPYLAVNIWKRTV